ncbi:hypothetical protein EJ02DRAFT_467997 [Clathrospora elynae]|uniref:Uncharacterized protein n=1 Tax=Clathrospora elynae TaxID=706981 RepID=A0A6A5SM84_9PLEO|nr:hypothetical protein EJ02DRAFT_467997 [Clathrospora elynae]
MHSFILLAVVAIIATVSAIPITPSAPRLQKRAEQFRLQGLKEFEIAERLSTPTTSSTVDPWRTRMNNKFHTLFHSPSSDNEQDFSGDIAPGSFEAPQILPKASASEGATFLESLGALFHRAESSFGYEGKELELRRPEGMRDWKMSYGGFRR